MSNQTAIQRYRDLVRSAVEVSATTLPATVPQEELERATERMLSAFRTAASADPQLYQCEPASVARAVAMTAYTGLYPGGPLPDVYIYRRRRNVAPRNEPPRYVQELQWMPSARGLKRLVERDSGAVLEAVLVYNGEAIEAQTIQGATVVRHVRNPLARPALTEGQDPMDIVQGGYVQARLADGRAVYRFLDREGLRVRRANSDSFDKGYGPWVSWPFAMMEKTLLRYAIGRSIVPLDPQHPSAIAVQEDDQDAQIQDVVAIDPARTLAPAQSGTQALADALAAAEGVPEDAEPDATEPAADKAKEGADG